MIPPRIEDVKPLDNFCLEITYVTKEKRIYDMKKILHYDFCRNLNNIGYFKLVKSALTTVEWPNGEDVDPNELYGNSVIINSND